MKEKEKPPLFKNKKLKMFLIFLSLSILFWFLSKLSKEYTNLVVFKTKYTNIATNKQLQNVPLEEVRLMLKTNGFNLISYKLNKPRLKIDLTNIQKLKKKNYYCILNKQLSNLQGQLNAETTIIAVDTDTIFFDFGILKEKKVKIIPNLNLNFKSGYYLTDIINLEPNTITISGPEKLIDSIMQVETKQIVYDNVFRNINKKIALNTLESVKYSTQEVKVIAKVEKFTEGNIQLPFTLINVHDSINVSTFTNKVMVTYKVSLQNFDKISAKDFKVICDFRKAQKDSLNFLVPEFIVKSSLVSELKIEPSKIEYLINK